MSSEIKIGSVNRSFTHRHPQKTSKHTETTSYNIEPERFGLYRIYFSFIFALLNQCQ